MLDKQRIIRLHAALGAAGKQDNKEDILAGYGVASSKELTTAQADEIIDKMNEIAEQKKSPATNEIRKQRSVVLTLLNDLGLYVTNNDWKQVNCFLLQPRIAGKLLFQMNKEELVQLQRKLRLLIKKREETIQQEQYLATNN